MLNARLEDRVRPLETGAVVYLTNLEDFARARDEGNQQVLQDLIYQMTEYLRAEGCSRDQIIEIAKPAVIDAYRKYLEFAEPHCRAIERDIVGTVH